MGGRPTRCKHAILQQLCQLIPAGLVDRLARKHGVDRKARTFSAWSHLVALLHAQLTHAMSLNDVCDAMRQHAGKLLAVRGATPPARNTLSHANRGRDGAMAEELFWRTLEHLHALSPGFGARHDKKRRLHMPRRFTRTVRAVDATTIQLVANSMDWAKHRRRKAAAKLHVSLDLQSFLPAFVVVDAARHHEATRAATVCAGMKAGEIAVFDKAFIAFGFLADLTARGVFWVTRAKQDMAVHCVRRRLRRPQGDILSDNEVVLAGDASRAKHPGRLRLVRALVEVDGQRREMTFLTNNLQWAASSICDLYKSRWAIEVFFKEIKQTLQLCDFLGHNRNAILWQVWTALLLYVLLRFIEFVHGWQRGFKRLFCLLRSCVWDANTIASILAACGTARGHPVLIAAPQQAYLPGFEP